MSEQAIHTAIDDWTDLADRAGDGLLVTLLWSRSSGRVKVTVVNVRTGQHAELDVAPADALTAFHHPFAYSLLTQDDQAAAELRPAFA